MLPFFLFYFFFWQSLRKKIAGGSKLTGVLLVHSFLETAIWLSGFELTFQYLQYPTKPTNNQQSPDFFWHALESTADIPRV